MAESENSIEYPKAMIVQVVRVHHRNCSQISTSAERLGEYSYKKNDDTQSASDLYSVQRGYPMTAVERMRAYRARQKEKKMLENPRKSKKSDAERAREYRARKKAKTQSTVNYIRNVPNSNESRIVRDNQSIREQIQEHRNQSQNLVEARLIQESQNKTNHLVYTDFYRHHLAQYEFKNKKSVYTKLHRQTEQEKPQAVTLKIEFEEEHEDYSESVKDITAQVPVLPQLQESTTVVQHTSSCLKPSTLVEVKVEPPDEESTYHTAKPPKTKAEYQKAYRERQKAKKNKYKQESTAKPPKTKAEYQKEYRERQKAKKNEIKQESTAKPPKTNAEHQKAFRERQKMKNIKNKRESNAALNAPSKINIQKAMGVNRKT